MMSPMREQSIRKNGSSRSDARAYSIPFLNDEAFAATLAATVMVVLGNLLADLLYAVADPRIRVERP